MFAKLIARAWDNPWLLLSLCILFWASNVVAARIAPGEISPILLGGLRWAVASAIMTPIVWRPMLGQRAVISRHWLFILLASGVGYTLYSVLFFGAGALTSGVNISCRCSPSLLPGYFCA